MVKIIDRTGIRYGRLLVTGPSESRISGKRSWECLCDCGSTISIKGDRLSGDARSCGCLLVESSRRAGKMVAGWNTGKASEFPKEYNAWRSMRQRCTNPKNHAFQHYGGRGISVCHPWRESFDSFLDDMGVCEKGLTLERVDVNGDYTPENCIWASSADQGINRRNTIRIEYNGDLKPLTVLCREHGIARQLGYTRYKAGWGIHEILNTPSQRSG